MEFSILQIFLFNFSMAADDSIMHNKNVTWSVKMRVGIFDSYLSTSCPSCMTNSNMGFINLFIYVID